MTDIPAELKYTSRDEWIRVAGNKVTIGITDFAQGELTDIVYVELPGEGDTIEEDGPLGVVESVKASSEVSAPLSGTVIRTNDKLEDSPELVNQDPYGEGWLVELEVSDMSQLDKLLSADQYKAHLDSK